MTEPLAGPVASCGGCSACVARASALGMTFEEWQRAVRAAAAARLDGQDEQQAVAEAERRWRAARAAEQTHVLGAEDPRP